MAAGQNDPLDDATLRRTLTSVNMHVQGLDSQSTLPAGEIIVVPDARRPDRDFEWLLCLRLRDIIDRVRGVGRYSQALLVQLESIRSRHVHQEIFHVLIVPRRGDEIGMAANSIWGRLPGEWSPHLSELGLLLREEAEFVLGGRRVR